MAAGAAAGIAAVGAAAAAGYYFYASDNAKRHRKEAAKWAAGFKNEVIREARQLQNIDARSIARAVDTAAATYAGVRSINRADLNRAAKELKANWQRVQAEVAKTGKRAASRTRRTAKRVAKKAKRGSKKSTRSSVKRSVKRRR